MAVDLEENNSEGFDLQHYWGIVRRRHIHFLIPFFIGWVAVWSATWVLPPRYQSSTLILVEQPTMPKDYVTPNISDNLQERLQSITQQILSRTRLLHIIDQFGLYGGQSSKLSADEKVLAMRNDIGIELVRDRSGQISSFNVSYTSRDPQIAQHVTTQLTDLFIDENLEVRQRQSEGTTKFLENQLEAARLSLSEQEEKIRQFKGQHIGELPAQVESNLQILSGVQSQLRTEEDSLNSAKQQRVYLQSLADQYRNLKVAPAADGAPTGLAAMDQELSRLKSQLADLSSHYTDRHPDVRKLQEQIAKTQRQRDQLVSQSQAGDGNPSANGSAQPTMLAQVQSQLQSNQIEITNREHAISDLKSKITEYQARLNQEPVREQQLADLTRGYDQSKATYDELLKKKNESAMATSMELLQQGERFRVLDPPSLPTKPDFPNRLKFCGIGVAVGLALGVFVAGIFEFLDDRLYNEKQIKELLPATVICEIPVVKTALEERAEKARLRRDWAATAAVIIVILAGSVFSFLRG
jgi:polysaccharide chain length determinant protein (PEP-CTERM system associated)